MGNAIPGTWRRIGMGAELYEAQHRKQQVIHLKRKAAQLGLEIIEVAAAA